MINARGKAEHLHSAHEQTEQGSNCEKLFECFAVNCRNLQKPQNDHVHHHWPFSSKLVSCQSEDCRTNRPEKECKSDGLGNPRLADIVVLGKLDRLNAKGVEIECLVQILAAALEYTAESGTGQEFTYVCSPGCETDDEEHPIFS